VNAGAADAAPASTLHRDYDRRIGDSLVLGRVFGIRIGLNWSWLVIAGLLVWSLAGAVFPDTNPGLSDGTYVVMAVVAALLFFVCLLLHELGHAVQARRDHVAIEGITLWMLGGVAKLTGRVPSAGAELRIALAGPAVSLILGLAFAGIAAGFGLPEEIDGVAAWLGYVNLLLLGFNLIPAFPLDGGRVLFGGIWAATHDVHKATRVAVTVSRGAALLMIGGGVLLTLTGGVTGGIWLVFIGWFLLQAARAEAAQRMTEERLGGLRVRDLMTTDPVSVPADMSLSDFVDEVVWRARVTTYPVVANGAPLGLLPFSAVAEVPRARWDETSVEECMLPLEQIPVLSSDVPVAEAFAEVASSHVRRALVVDDGRLTGILSITDLLRALELGRPPGRS
jgi:Zn-dependent protease/predicted transcriptional regulator